MKITDITEATTEYVKKDVDPALMTFDEYHRYLNDQNKFHPPAYRWSVESDSYYSKKSKSEYPKLLNNITRRGIRFEFRVNIIDRLNKTYYKKSPETNEWLRDDHGELVPFTKDELHAGAIPSLISDRYDYEIGIFDNKGQFVGGSQDEWGCMLLHIADEYQGFGLGPLLAKFARHFNPSKPSGGFTTAGFNNLKRMHTAMVRKYLQSGMYSFLVRSGQLSKEKAKEIIASVDISTKKVEKSNYGSDDPSDWLLFVEDDAFIIYDKKLANMLSDDAPSFWTEKMIKGMIYVAIDHDYGRIKTFGGDSDDIKKFLLTMAAMDAKYHDVPLVIEPEDVDYVDNEKMNLGELSVDAGYKGYPASYTDTVFDATHLGGKERSYRASFDKYDEFKHTMMEMAYAKYQK